MITASCCCLASTFQKITRHGFALRSRTSGISSRTSLLCSWPPGGGGGPLPEGWCLDKSFPDVPGKFYCFLAGMLANRLRRVTDAYDMAEVQLSTSAVGGGAAAAAVAAAPGLQPVLDRGLEVPCSWLDLGYEHHLFGFPGRCYFGIYYWFAFRRLFLFSDWVSCRLTPASLSSCFSCDGVV